MVAINPPPRPSRRRRGRSGLVLSWTSCANLVTRKAVYRSPEELSLKPFNKLKSDSCKHAAVTCSDAPHGLPPPSRRR